LQSRQLGEAEFHLWEADRGIKGGAETERDAIHSVKQKVCDFAHITPLSTVSQTSLCIQFPHKHTHTTKDFSHDCHGCR